MKVQGKTIVVTGAGGGIGSGIVLELLRRNAKVVAIDLRQEALDALRQRSGDLANNLSLQVLNITDRAQVASVAKKIGSVDGLMNVAGIIQPFIKVNDLDYDAIERVMQVNFYGTLYMTKAFLPGLLKRPEAHIVNVSSMGGFLPVPGQSVYGASKAAIKLLTEGLYAELRQTNVRVSVVFPGATATDITKNSGVSVPKVSPQQQKAFPSLSPSDAAKQIIDGMERNKAQIYTGKDSKAMNVLYRFKPVFATNFIANKMRSLLE